MKKLFVLGLSVFFLTVIISFAQAINIDSPPYLNLSPDISGDGGLDLTENIIVNGTCAGHATIEITLTNNNAIAMNVVHFIPSLIAWGWTDGTDWYNDKLYYQSTSGSTVTYSNTINDKLFVTNLTYLEYASIDIYTVEDDFPAFWTFPASSYTAGVDDSNPDTFYGKELGGLNAGEAVTFHILSTSTVNGVAFPDVQWGLPNQTATTFDFDWDDAGIPVPEPSTIILLTVSAYFCLRHKRNK